MRITEVYLEIASFIYLTIILIFYLKKKKINTIENIIFKAMIITSVFVCLSDAVSTLYSMEYPTSMMAHVLVKWKLICMTLEMLFCTYYIFCITSKKSVGWFLLSVCQIEFEIIDLLFERFEFVRYRFHNIWCFCVIDFFSALYSSSS